jgi:hypothetical protein
VQEVESRAQAFISNTPNSLNQFDMCYKMMIWTPKARYHHFRKAFSSNLIRSLSLLASASTLPLLPPQQQLSAVAPAPSLAPPYPARTAAIAAIQRDFPF